MTKTLIQGIAAAIVARENCRKSGNREWFDIHGATLDRLARQLPSGSGIDSGTKIALDDCKPGCIVLLTAFHHMNDAGMYDGWTNHKVRVRPSFDGFTLSISGRDRKGIKDYLGELFHHALSEPVKVE